MLVEENGLLNMMFVNGNMKTTGFNVTFRGEICEMMFFYNKDCDTFYAELSPLYPYNDYFYDITGKSYIIRAALSIDAMFVGGDCVWYFERFYDDCETDAERCENGILSDGLLPEECDEIKRIMLNVFIKCFHEDISKSTWPYMDFKISA